MKLRSYRNRCERACKLRKQPRCGDTIDTRFGDAVVVDVEHRGLRLSVESPTHGIETVERAETGWWTIYLDA